MEFHCINPTKVLEQAIAHEEQKILLSNNTDKEALTNRDRLLKTYQDLTPPKPAENTELTRVAKQLASLNPGDYNSREAWMDEVEARYCELTQVIPEVPTRDNIWHGELWPETEVTKTGIFASILGS